jgi:lambda family phage tail tape measure protein
VAGDSQLKFSILARVIGAQAITALKTQVSGVGDAAKKTKLDLSGLATGVKAFAGAAAVIGTFRLAKGLIDLGDEMAALSERTGISVKDLAAFKGAAEQADLPFEGLVGSLKKFTQNLGSVKVENNATAKVLKSLGIAALDSSGQIRGSGDVIKDLADRFSTLRDGPEKAAIAVKLFGKAGSEIIPFLNQGSDAITKFGLAIDQDFAARADQFNDTLTVLGNRTKSIFIEGLGAALPTLQEVLNAFVSFPGKAEGVVTVFESLGEAVRLVAIVFDGFVTAFIQGVDTIQDLFRGVGTGIAFTASNIVDSLSTTGTQLKALAKGNFSEVGRLQREYEARQKQLEADALAERERKQKEFFDRVNARQKAFSDRAGALAKNSFILGEGSLEEIRKRQRDATAVPPKPSGGSAPDVADTERSTKLQNELNAARALREAGLLEIETERFKLDAYKYSGEELAKLTERKKTEIEITKATKNFTAEGALAYREAAEAVLAQKEALISLDAQQKLTFTVGIAQGARDYLEKVRDIAAQTKEAFTSAFKGLEDAIVNFAKTGKLEFRDFADAVISDMIRIAVRQAIIAPILGGITGLFSPGAAVAGTFGGGPGVAPVSGFANGGIMTAAGSVPLRKYASGGIARSPQLALYGEGSRPEAFVPLPDGRRIPVSMEGGGGVNVTVNVSVERGTEKVSAEADDNTGKSLGRLISNAVKNELIQQKRPGGLLA